MFIKCLPTGMFGSNCYVVGNNGEGVVIDPGVKAVQILEAVRNANIKIKYIILTHAHIDHIISVDNIRDGLGAEVLIHEKDAEALSDSFFNASALFGGKRAFRKADRTLKDGDVLHSGGMEYEIIHTPGHTGGGICIKTGSSLFTGDTLFKMSIGRTDLGDGDYDEIMRSIKEKLMTLDDNTIVYPGHGESTTIGFERRNNPFLC